MNKLAAINIQNLKINSKIRDDFKAYLKIDEVCRRASEAMNHDQATRSLKSTETYFRNAYHSLANERHRYSQIAKSVLSRESTYRIGPVLPAPPKHRPLRALRTPSGFQREFIRPIRALGQKLVWKELRHLCVSVSDDGFVEEVLNVPKGKKWALRYYSYLFFVGGKRITIRYSQFEKRFAEARYPVALVG